jgi:PAS domain S-box-containing protein
MIRESGEAVGGLGADQAVLVNLEAERIRLVEALRISQLHFDESQRTAHVGSWEWELPAGSLWWSDEACRIFGIEPGTFGGTQEAFLALVHPDDREAIKRAAASLATDDPLPTEYRIVRNDGTIGTLHDVGEVIRDADGKPVRFVGTTQDVTEAVAADEERMRLVSAVEQTADSIWMQDLNNMVTYVNPAFTRAYGYPSDAIVGRHARLVDSGRHPASFFTDVWATAAGGETWAGSIINRRMDGTEFEVAAVISGIRDASGRIVSYMQTDRDVTRERALESALERDARERGSIEAALARIDSTATPEEIAAIACSEIVGLTSVDSAFVVILDPEAGWILAAEGLNADRVSPGMPISTSRLKRLQESAERGPWVDAWRPSPDDDASGQMLTSTGLHSMAYAPFPCVGDSIGLIGIAAYDEVGAALLVERLPALVTFGSIVGTLIGPRLGVRRHAAAERAAMQALIDTERFRTFFQPIVDLTDGSVPGYEALTRFADGRPPGIVFGAAARAGLGLELETACLHASIRAADRLPPDAYLSLNASPALIASGTLSALFAPIRRAIILEITEHVAIEDYDAVRCELAKLGPHVRLAVDDAGAGYASFRHILELAPDFVKVDIALVRNVDTEPARQALIAGMGYFAVKGGLHLIAEGIETREELESLRALGVPFGQGFLLGRPRDAGESESWPARIGLPTAPSSES